MTLRLLKTAFQIGSAQGVSLELYDDGARIASAELMLPAYDDAVDAAIDKMAGQASRYNVRINGQRRIALFHEIETGAVA